MSAKATFWAWHQPIKPASAKLVLLCLADCHNGDNGQCNPSVPYISKQTGLNRKTIIAAIEKLEEIHAIDCYRRAGYSTQFHINTPPKNGSTEIGTPPKNGMGNPSQKRDGGTPKNGRGPLPKTGHEPKREPKKEPKRKKTSRKCALPDDFEITDQMRAWADEKVPGFDIDNELESWADYWKGEGEKKSDWVATWRNGMKSRAARFAKSNETKTIGEAVF